MSHQTGNELSALGSPPPTHGDTPAQGLSYLGGGDVAVWRKIHRELFGSQDLCDLPLPARYLWVGLICFADDEGHLRASLWWLKRRIFLGTRTSASKIAGYLCQLKAKNMIRFDGYYARKFQKQLQDDTDRVVITYEITNFDRYQSAYKKRREEKRGEERKTFKQLDREDALTEERRQKEAAERKEAEHRAYLERQRAEAMDPVDFQAAVKDLRAKLNGG